MQRLAERVGLGPRTERHFVVVPKLGLAYGRIPKVANTSIRTLLARHVRRTPEGREMPPNTDAFWQTGTEDAAILSAAELKARHPDVFVFSFVRDPFDRLVSCWCDMIDRPRTVLPALAANGFAAGMDFAAFLRHAATVADRRADLHVRAQAAMLVEGGRVVPDFVGRYERLAEDWDVVVAEAHARSGIRLDPLPQSNIRRRDRSDVPLLFADPALIEIARTRYAEDFRHWYPDRAEPRAGIAPPRPEPKAVPRPPRRRADGRA